MGEYMKSIGPFQLEKILLCSADASPNSQRKNACEAAYFFPKAKWVGAIRNVSNQLGCDFVILTTGHGLVNPNDIIAPFDLHIEQDVEAVRQKWKKTISELLRSTEYEVMVFYSGGCPRDRYIELLKPILHALGISLITFGKPNMYDVGKTTDIVELLNRGTVFPEIASILKLPERLEYYPA